MADNNDHDTKNLHKKPTAPLIPPERDELERRFIELDAAYENALEAIRDLKLGHAAEIERLEHIIQQKAARILALEETLALSLKELELRFAPLDILVKFLNKHFRGASFDKLTLERRVDLWIKEYQSMATENQYLRATRPHEPAKSLTPPPALKSDRTPTPRPGSLRRVE